MISSLNLKWITHLFLQIILIETIYILSKVIDNSQLDSDLIDEKSFIKNYLLEKSRKIWHNLLFYKKNVDELFNFVALTLGKNATKYHAGLTKKKERKSTRFFK